LGRTATELYASTIRARAAASEQDRALFLTAAFTGLRMGELQALRCRDVYFFRLDDPRERRGLAAKRDK
jgi:integrase